MISPILSLEQVIALGDSVIYCDVRYSLQQPDGSQAFAEGHIPGARYISMDNVLAGKAGPIVGRHPLPTAQSFADALGDLGIGTAATVIAYDGMGGQMAGRLVWMLRVIGQEAALLDGGLDAWKNRFGADALETGPVSVEPVARPAIDWPQDAIVDSSQVETLIDQGVSVLDSRSSDRYRGENEPMDPKAGHVPGAANLPFAGNYQDGGLYFQPLDKLRQRMTAAKVQSDSVFYCGSGVTACNNILVAEAAGLKRPRLYVGSWSGWSSEDRPVATGDS